MNWESVQTFFSSHQFMPHGHCYLWIPEILWLNVGSDVLIAFSYYTIPISLILIARRRKDIPFNRLFMLFAAFILACGTTHLFEVWTTWNPQYGVQGLLKFFTGIISVFTALSMIPLVPKIISLPSPSQLKEAHEQLQQAHRDLEIRVQERTHELAEANRALQESQIHLHSILNNLPIVLWSFDAEGRYTLIEGAAKKMLNLTSQDVVGQHFSDVLSEKPKLLANATRAASGDSFIASEEVNGVYLETSYNSLLDSVYQQVGVVAISFDVTDLKRANQERESLLVQQKAVMEASRLKSEFLANMSHEIRTPLNGVSGMSKLLRETKLDFEQGQMVDAIEACSETLLSIVNNILDISKIEAGKLLLEEKAFDLHDCLQHAMAVTEIQGNEKNLIISLEIAESVPKVLIGDMYRFHQVVINILSNAVKFTERGHVAVRALSEPAGEGQVWVTIDVKDTGIGIAEDVQQKLFTYFSQADASTTRRFGGTGLGLTIAKNLCEAMDGGIRVESRPGEGSCFTFTVLLKSASIREPVVNQWKDRKFSQELSQRSDLSILVVEDNLTNRKLMKSFLRKLGFSSDDVEDGEQAVTYAENGQYDVIFMDMHMPVLDGIEASRRIRALPALKKQPHIVAVTASALLEDRENCREAGMDDFLTKPITVQNLMRCLDAAIGKQKKGTGPYRRPESRHLALNSSPEDPEIFAEMARLYFRQSQEILKNLREATRARDYSRVQSLSHTLKGTVLTFTPEIGVGILSRIEQEARERRLSEAEDLLASLLSELTELDKAIHSRLAQTV